MIPEKDAHKVYGRHTEVVRRGDKGWTSDRNHAQEAKLKSLGATESKAHQKLQSQRYHLNPTSLMTHNMAMQARAEIPDDLPEPQTGGLEITRPEGSDVVCYRVVERDGVLYWRRAWVNKGAAR